MVRPGHFRSPVDVIVLVGVAPSARRRRPTLTPHAGDMRTAPSVDAQCMAAAADRLSGDVLERVSPELVLVDAALAEEMRRRLGVPDDTFTSIGRMDIEPRLSVHVAEVEAGVEEETGVARDALAGDEVLPAPAAAIVEERGDLGIDDLIVIPEDELRSVPPTLRVVPNEDITQLAPEPEEIVAARVSETDDVIVVPADDRVQQTRTRTYPALPSPSSDADEEDATDVVLRLIRDHIDNETPPKRRRRRLVSFVSLLAALSSIAIFVAHTQRGVSELPQWLPS